jgi:hypothetical protein
MCLWIKQDQEENDKDLKKWFGNRKKFAYVYKVLRKWPEENFYRSSVYSNFIWDFSKEKVFEVRRSRKPTKKELGRTKISDGLHIFTSLETAKKYFYSTHCKNAIIAKFRVLKEDIVTVENNWELEKNNRRQAVCTRLEFVKVIED